MKIGILGGGQLARMIIEENYKYGYDFIVLTKENNSPAGQITKNEVVGDWNDNECLKNFAGNCDLITLENEFIDFQKIKLLEDTDKPVYPGSGIVKLVQDKLFQKTTLNKLGIPLAKFCEVNSKNDIINFAEENSYPLILKSRTMGYDGKGNYEIKSEDEIDEALKTLSERGKLMCESFVKFDKEIAIQFARNKSGEIKIYPVVETIQENHICKLVIASKKKFTNIREKVILTATKIATELNYIGVMGIEMFLLGEDIYVNELAPRVHNSGHYTIEGCYTSQFENHLRSILNFPLGNVNMRDENSVMINILGKRNGVAKLKRAGEILKMDKVYIHIYGKKETSIGRKMGHITVLNDDMQNALNIAGNAREKIDI